MRFVAEQAGRFRDYLACFELTRLAGFGLIGLIGR